MHTMYQINMVFGWCVLGFIVTAMVWRVVQGVRGRINPRRLAVSSALQWSALTVFAGIDIGDPDNTAWWVSLTVFLLAMLFASQGWAGVPARAVAEK